MRILHCSGCIITVAATGASLLPYVDPDADHGLALKENPARLRQDEKHLFADPEESGYYGYEVAPVRTAEKVTGT